MGPNWGYVDTHGAIVIPPNYEEAREFHDGRAAVRIGDVYGYIDMTGQMVIPAAFGVARDFSEGRAWVVPGTRPCWIRSEVFDLYDVGRSRPHFIADRPSHYELSIPNCRYSLVDRDGEIVSEIDFDDVRDFSEGLAAVGHFNGGWTSWGFVDQSGEFEIHPLFNSASSFSEGLAAVSTRDKLVGYIGHYGKFAIEPKYWSADPFSDGLAAVSVRIGRESRNFYINAGGVEALDSSFYCNQSFVHGLAGVSTGPRSMSYINVAGEVVYQFKPG